RQTSVVKSKARLPWVEPLIFLSATGLNCKLAGNARARVYLRGQPGAPDDAGIVAVLLNGVQGSPDTRRVDRQQARTLLRAMVDAGIRQSNKHRRVGDYQLGGVIGEGENFQDWEGQHVSIDGVRRRIRIYTFASAATEQARKTLIRHAERD